MGLDRSNPVSDREQKSVSTTPSARCQHNINGQMAACRRRREGGGQTTRRWVTMGLVLAALSQPAASLTIQRALVPLAGAPNWMPKLHHAAVVNLEESEVDEHIRHEAGSSRTIYIDFLPLHPRDPSVMLKLLSGMRVEGRLRRRWLRALPRGAVLTEPVRDVADDLTVEGVIEAAERFPSKEQLWLAGNNCCSFVEW
eukprot:CAMPEP_0119482000 /NCGR_PEP_ID=MMETSP1344-20130328/10064_1 /TAXON_ID=236787 /ORGANISM="Florenciella parvula, Strain CCMP2471" /LENGTH=197 /DNA_ID=CAMNT_0007516385 /DNA_START=77 /DNA_END=667 /DNA_ORIENTATION=-